ncbi:MAG: hypothetical protein IKO93_10800 [Lentisphaeria bacterium]|nr:hypothetical protein [Lentisphaeria bacterium]
MTEKTIDLNGLWEFFYSPEALSPDPEKLPAAAAYTGRMAIPGYWDDHYDLFDEEDFFGLTARFNPDYRPPYFPCGRTLTPHASSSFLIGTGYCRRMLPPLEDGMLATLRIGPAMWGGAVFCNGRYAGRIEGYSTATEFALEKLMYADRPNELIIAVCNVHDDGGAYCRVDGSHDGIVRGARAGQHRGLAVQGYQSERGGIAEGVSLKITRQAEIAEWFPWFDGQRMHCGFSVRGKSGWVVRWQVCNGKTVLFSGETTESAWECDAAALARWSDRDPKLYEVTLELMLDGEVADSVSGLWAPRTFTVAGKNLHLNGQPVYLRGVTEHCYFPKSCNPHWDEAKYLRDLGVLKQAGFNFIRCHTWCPPEAFYNACDKLGFLVQTELPVMWSWTEAEAIIRQIRRHPCAVILCEGNEKIIDGPAMERLRQLAEKLHSLAPGMLFNPQEAMRGIEYEFAPGQQIAEKPFPHDPERLAATGKFADVYGSLGGGWFSYEHEYFPGPEAVEAMHDIYPRPCLSHEIGILGGYLDFSLEPRYENTFIGTGMFEAARRHMRKRGVWEFRRLYYERNCRFISSLRKQLVENLRACRNITGYDYLGGIDTHWHLTGYPCGVFNEFYEEKFGETAADVRLYTGESVLLLSCGNRRNFTIGSKVSLTVSISHYGAVPVKDGTVSWTLLDADGRTVTSGKWNAPFVECGTVASLGEMRFQFPETGISAAYMLKVELVYDGHAVANQWKLWAFPKTEKVDSGQCRVVNQLDSGTVDFMAAGGSVLLTGGFPCTTFPERFGTHCSGRVLGHSGAIPHAHPVWEKFVHDGFADWQFFPLMTRDSISLVQDGKMPEYAPLLELIPSFKMVYRKSLLSEYEVGTGRLMCCGLHLDADDPAAAYLKQVLIAYLNGSGHVSAPKWDPDALKARCGKTFPPFRQGNEVDPGGRPL